MAKKTLFNATFEESLNLQDDSVSGQFISSIQREAEEKEKYRGTVKSYVWLLILTVLFVFIPNWLIAKVSHYLLPSVENYFGNPVTINFLPEWVFWFLCLIWLSIILGLKRFNQRFILIYRGQFHLFVTFLLWLMIELNLFFLTIFYSALGVYGIICFVSLLSLLSYLIIKSRLNSLYFLLYGIKKEVLKKGLREELTKLGKLFTKILLLCLKYILVIVLGLLLLQSFFPTVCHHFFSMTGMMILWLVGNLLFVTFESYYIFPYFLQAYYKLTYPEDYRDWEGKSYEEWYG